MLSVIIPTYNRRESVLQLLADVCRQKNADFEVIVVDDGSQDGTTEAIRNCFPEVIVLHNDGNQGPCVARNRGICHAHGDIIVGFDSDVTVPDLNTLEKVRAIFDQEINISGVAFRLFSEDGKTDDVGRWWHPVPIAQYSKKRFTTNYFSGTAFAFRKRILKNVGLFPEVVFQQSEEVWLSLRILDANGTIVYIPELTVLHHVGLTVNRPRGKGQLFYKPRNQILLTFGCYPLWRGIGYLIPRICFNFFKALREGHLKTFLFVFIDAVRTIPIVWKQRKPVKSQTFQRMAAMRQQS